MKQIILLALFSTATLVSFSQSAQEKQVAAAIETLRKAMLDGDSSTLAKLTDEALVYGHSSGKMENKEQFVGSLASGTSDFKSIELSDQKIVVKGSTAVVRHKLTGEVVDNGNAASVNLSVLLVWYKSGNKWILLSRQAVKV